MPLSSLQVYGKCPSKYFFVSGSGEGSTFLNAFDSALLGSGVGNTNLVRMTSIIPPNAKRLDQPIILEFGSLVPVAYAFKVSDNVGAMVSSGVGVALPDDKTKPGVIMEHSIICEQKSSVEDEQQKLREIIYSMLEEAFLIRKEKVKDIEFIAKTHLVKNIGASFAGVVLCN